MSEPGIVSRSKGGGAAAVASRIVPTQLAHFVIRTRNVQTLVNWYKAVFQADSAFENGSIAFLYFDNEHHRIAIGEVPGLEPPNPRAAGFDHVAFSYGSIEDLLANYERLKALGIEPYFNIDHGLTTSLYYKDPDGNQIEFQVNNFESQALAHEYFRSKAFAENPIGVEIDPDTLLRRWKAGEAPHYLLGSGTRPCIER
jgi:catechol 2,3-dioxygenase-like lactoylglutathione lyase family enzyme